MNSENNSSPSFDRKNTQTSARMETSSHQETFEELLRPSLIDRISQWEGWFVVYERRYPILIALLLFIVLIVSGGVWMSRNRERASLAAFQTTEIMNEIEETDYAQRVPPISSDRAHSNDPVHKVETTNTELLETEARKLFALGGLSDEAQEKSSGLLLSAATALKNNSDSTEKELLTPQEEAKLLNLSNNYFSNAQLNAYKKLNELMDAIQRGQVASDEAAIAELQGETKAQDLAKFMLTLASPMFSASEKVKAARLFFTTYPELAHRFEEISGQNNEIFYSFIEKEFGQQVFESSKN